MDEAVCTEGGIILGRDPSGSVVLGGNGNSISIGPCRTGKTLRLISNLLCPEIAVEADTNPSVLRRLFTRPAKKTVQAGFTAPVVVFDSHGVMLAVSLLARLRQGRKVVVIDPFGCMEETARTPGFEHLAEVPVVSLDSAGAPAFDLSELFAGRCDIFVIYNHADCHAAPAALGALAEKIIVDADGGGMPVVAGGIDMIVDELFCLAWRRMQSVIDKLAASRSGNLRVHVSAQSEEQFRAVCGGNMADMIYANAATVNTSLFFKRVDDPMRTIINAQHEALNGECVTTELRPLLDLKGPEFRGLALPHPFFDRNAPPSPQLLAELRAKLAAAGTDGIAA